VTDRFLHELFDQRLAPCVQHPPTKTAAEPTNPGESNASDFDRFTIEHGHAGAQLRDEATMQGSERLCRG
jgi:hypothetical protein